MESKREHSQYHTLPQLHALLYQQLQALKVLMLGIGVQHVNVIGQVLVAVGEAMTQTSKGECVPDTCIAAFY